MLLGVFCAELVKLLGLGHCISALALDPVSRVLCAVRVPRPLGGLLLYLPAQSTLLAVSEVTGLLVCIRGAQQSHSQQQGGGACQSEVKEETWGCKPQVGGHERRHVPPTCCGLSTSAASLVP